jgi:creatinine amidohydrolase
MDLSIYDLCDGDFRDRLAQTQSAIIPVGSLEQHGQHLPVSTDCLIAEHISIDVSQRLEYFVFPVVPYGVSFEHAPMFNVSVRDSTLSKILCDICVSIAHLGIKRIVIINGHHGNMGVLQYVSQNTFDRMPRESAVHVLNYWSFMNEIFDHAGEVETSILLAIKPGLVKMDKAEASSKILMKSREAYRSMTLRPGSFPKVTGNGVWGNPKFASAEKGRELLSEIGENIIRTTLELE